jgi:hypothetical protein
LSENAAGLADHQGPIELARLWDNGATADAAPERTERAKRIDIAALIG